MTRARDDRRRNMRAKFATTHADGSFVGFRWLALRMGHTPLEVQGLADAYAALPDEIRTGDPS